jgi:hypothetical protein
VVMAGAGSAVVRRQLGSKLRQLRLAAGKDVADVVTAGLASKAKMSRIEGGKGPVKIADVRALCWLYGASAETTEALAALAPGTQQEDWWETYENVVVPDWFGLYVGLEQSASRLRCFDPELVHGLLQTEDYARAVIESEDTLEPKVIAQRLQFRMDRQRRVLDGHPDLTVVLGAGALSLVVGSPDAMAAQLDHMRQLARDKVASIRFLPWSVGAYPMRGSFALLDFDSNDDPTVAYVEFSMGARYVEQSAQVEEYEHVFDVLLNKSVSIEEWSP